MNIYMFNGRISKDIYVIRNEKNEIVKVAFDVATEKFNKKTRKKETCGFNSCIAWNGVAEMIYNTYKKGDLVEIKCENYITESWIDKKTNIKKYNNVFEIEKIEFMPFNENKKFSVDDVDYNDVENVRTFWKSVFNTNISDKDIARISLATGSNNVSITKVVEQMKMENNNSVDYFIELLYKG